MACASAMSVTGAFVAPVALVSGSKLSGKKMVLASSSSSSLSEGFVSKLIVNNKSRVTMRFVFFPRLCMMIFCSACRVEDYVSCCFDVMFKLCILLSPCSVPAFAVANSMK